MSPAVSEFEMEALPELESEGEYEYEWESEAETEEFLGALRRLGGWARTQWATPGSGLRRAALGAGRAALTGGGTLAGTLLGGPAGGVAGATMGAGLGGFLPEREYELEGEWEEELSPIRRVYTDALMEHMGHAATRAHTEAEAEAFIGALVPLAARLIPRVAPAIMRAAPRLIRGVSAVARTLRRSPVTRPLVRTLPTVVRRTAASLAQQASRGGRVTPQSAVRTLARQTTRVLGSPQTAARAFRRSRALDRRYHQAAGPAGPGGPGGGPAPGPAGGPAGGCGCTCADQEW